MEFEGDVFFDSVAEGSGKPPQPVQPLASKVKQITIQDPQDTRGKSSKAKFEAQKTKAKKFYKEAKGKSKKMKKKVVTSTMLLLNSAVKEKPRGKWASKTVNFLFKKVENENIKNRTTSVEKPSFRPMPPPPTAAQNRPPLNERQPAVLAPVVPAPAEIIKRYTAPTSAPTQAVKKEVSFAPVPKLETSFKPVNTNEKLCANKPVLNPALVKANSSAVLRSNSLSNGTVVSKAKSDRALVKEETKPTVFKAPSKTYNPADRKDIPLKSKPQQQRKTDNSAALTQVGSNTKTAPALRPKVTRGKGEIYKKLYGSAGFPSVA